ncbi:hypothetical protein J3R30DRAFT_3703627 [Lentinula aciculospora]|uniref:BTB domain-containing protein n=1 Tax=Lentinula aciculospora TaxID=153920 RepID=A0A9W9ABU0_9AGAR|nr:hypothetical protein J3R30DRAFT_3703627 [Lentinula aciculospora]
MLSSPFTASAELPSSKDAADPPVGVKPDLIFGKASSCPLPSESAAPRSPVYRRNFSFYYDYRSFLVRILAICVATAVNEVLFRFPINLLAKESPVFRDMMELPVPSQAEGLTDENPIRLDGVSNADFVQLLTILAPPSVPSLSLNHNTSSGRIFDSSQRFKEPVPKLTFFEWTSVLKLADMWCMDLVKEHAISTMSNLSDVDAVDKIVAARMYGINSWLIPSYNEILRRSQSWDKRDVERLGLDTFLKLINFRERLQPYNQYGYDSSWKLGTERQPVSVDFSGVIKAELLDFEVETVATNPSSSSGIVHPDETDMLIREPIVSTKKKGKKYF